MVSVDDVRKITYAVVSNVVKNVLPSYSFPILECNLRGVCAGTAYPSLNKIRINLEITNEEELRKVIIHEIAHVVGRIKYGAKNHDKNWKRTVIEMGGIPERCHHMPLTKKRNCKEKYEYRCKCHCYKLTSIRHNRIVKGSVIYRCLKCNSVLERCDRSILDVN